MGASAWIISPFRSRIYEKIRAGLPQATLLPASMFFRYVRMIKTPEEIQRLRESAEVNEQAINAMLRACRPRVTENELASIYKGEIAKAGGQVYWMHMAVTRGGNFPAIKDNVLQKGDIFRVDMGCSINGYHADVCKSGCVGAEPTAEHRKRYDAIQAGVLKSVEALKPGVRPQELYETMIAGVRANGLPNYSNFFLGHTIGLEAREFPFLLGPAEEVDDPFLPNTTNIPDRARHDDEPGSLEPRSRLGHGASRIYLRRDGDRPRASDFTGAKADDVAVAVKTRRPMGGLQLQTACIGAAAHWRSRDGDASCFSLMWVARVETGPQGCFVRELEQWSPSLGLYGWYRASTCSIVQLPPV